MIYSKRYVQYNDLPFDNYDMLASYDDTSASFKTSGTSYTFKHGAYYGQLKEHGLISQTSVSFTLKVGMKRLQCEDRKYFVQWMKNELTKSGKLWAVQNNELIWAYAIPDNISQVDSADNVAELDVDLILPEGVWHKADKQKTFLVPYDICDWSACHDFKTIDPCYEEKECCVCMNGKESTDSCCECDAVEKEDALCYFGDLQAFYGDGCGGSGYRIIYNCLRAEQLFIHDMVKALGQKICSNVCSPMIAGLVYSETDIPTDSYTIILDGKYNNPSITINGTTNNIKGEYDGQLIISSDGKVIYHTECCDTELDYDKWEIPTGNDFMWEFQQGNNSVLIDAGNCCGTNCVYIQLDNLTI